MFLEGEKVYKTLDEDDKEPEMLDQREALAECLGIELEDEESSDDDDD